MQTVTTILPQHPASLPLVPGQLLTVHLSLISGSPPPYAPLHLAHTISFPPPLAPTLTDSMDYDQFNTPIHAGPFSFFFPSISYSLPLPSPLEDLPPKMPGDVVRPDNLLADDADRCALHSSFLHHCHSSPYPILSF